MRVHLSELKEHSSSKSAINKQIEIIETIHNNDALQLRNLAEIFRNRISKPKYISNYVDGLIYKKLLNSQDSEIIQFTSTLCPQGIVPLKSEKRMNYQDLQRLLVQNDLMAADKLTQQKLVKLAGIDEQSRNWLYFTDVNKIPVQDLQTIDQLWNVHSKGKFGFFVQRQIWLTVEKDWEKLWHKIGWEVNRVPCRYPDEFQWNSNGPRGHLPLCNQLRGVQVLSALFSHKAWEK